MYGSQRRLQTAWGPGGKLPCPYYTLRVCSLRPRSNHTLRQQPLKHQTSKACCWHHSYALYCAVCVLDFYSKLLLNPACPNSMPEPCHVMFVCVRRPGSPTMSAIPTATSRLCGSLSSFLTQVSVPSSTPEPCSEPQIDQHTVLSATAFCLCL